MRLLQRILIVLLFPMVVWMVWAVMHLLALGLDSVIPFIDWAGPNADQKAILAMLLLSVVLAWFACRAAWPSRSHPKESGGDRQ